jgi:hypothetical protein
MARAVTPIYIYVKNLYISKHIGQRIVPALQELVGGRATEVLPALLISSASGTERGEVFYGPTDWLGSRDPMTHIRHIHDSSIGLAD